MLTLALLTSSQSSDVDNSMTSLKRHSHMTGLAGNGSVATHLEEDKENMNGEYREDIELTVILPDGRSNCLVVHESKQMMDLLVQVAIQHKLSPTGVSIVAYSEDSGQQIDYKASQTVGSLGVATIHLVSKKKENEKHKLIEQQKKAQQPFEKTQRLQVNLPKNQKWVARVSPKATLADIYKLICYEKNLDPYKYDLRHPTRPDEELNMASSVGDYGIHEITVVPCTTPARQRTYDPSEWQREEQEIEDSTMPRKKTQEEQSGYMPGLVKEKKKKGIFSLFSRKKGGKFTIDNSASYGEPSGHSSSASATTSSAYSASTSSSTLPHPPRSHSHSSVNGGQQLSVATSQSYQSLPRPQESAVESATLPRVAKANSKKRHAPPPPQQKIVESTPDISVAENSHSALQLTRTHSRDSSKSSGFDESPLTPLESPNSSRESSKTGSSNSVPTKTSIDAGSIDSAELNNERASSTTLTVLSEKGAAAVLPPGADNSLSHKAKSAQKKRRAPAPPPPRPSTDIAEPVATDTVPEAAAVACVEEEVHVEMEAPPVEHVQEAELEVVDGDAVIAELQNGGVVKQKPGKPPRPGGLPEDGSRDSDSQSQRLKPRPATFIAPPPPPDTPPPLDTPSFERTAPFYYGNGQRVSDSSVQVHVDLKDSPMSGLRRDSCGSDQGSVATVDTMDDIDMAFDDVIAVGEQALRDDEATKEEVSIFLEKMNELTEHAQQEVLMQHRDSESSASLPEEGSAQVDTLTVPKPRDPDSASESSSIACYDISEPPLEQQVEPALPDQTEPVVLLKKISTSEFQEESITFGSDSETASPVLEKEEAFNSASYVKRDTDDAVDSLEDQSFVTVVSVGGAGQIAEEPGYPHRSVETEDPASDSGTSTGTAEKSECAVDSTLACDEEITFDQEEVVYVPPPNPLAPLDEKDDTFIGETHETFTYVEYTQEPHIQQDTRTPVPDVIQHTETKPPKIEPVRTEPHVEPVWTEPHVEHVRTEPPIQHNRVQAARTELRTEPVRQEPAKPTPVVRSLREMYRRTHKSSSEDSGLLEVQRYYPAVVQPQQVRVKKEATRRPLSHPAVEQDRPVHKVEAYRPEPEPVESTTTSHIHIRPYSQVETTVKAKQHQNIEEAEPSRSEEVPAPAEPEPVIPEFKLEPRKITKEEKHKISFWGPRPWGLPRHKSEPSVNDVNVALANASAKEEGEVSTLTNGTSATTTSPVKDDQTLIYSSEGSIRGQKGYVRQRASLIFSPHSEEENESVLEEKSISMIALPVDRRSVPRDQVELEHSRQSQRNEENVLETVTAEHQPVVQTPSNLISTKSTPDINSNTADKNRQNLQAQYQELQKQFARWQQQLMDNQALLARKKLVPPAEQAVPVSSQPVKTAPVLGRQDAFSRSSSNESTGGSRFTTEELMAARSRLRSNSGSEYSISPPIETSSRASDYFPHNSSSSDVHTPSPVRDSPLSPGKSPQSPGPPPLPPVPPPAIPPPKLILQKPASKTKSSRFEPQLDPREELMLAIRGAGGRSALRKVPVNKTKWT